MVSFMVPGRREPVQVALILHHAQGNVPFCTGVLVKRLLTELVAVYGSRSGMSCIPARSDRD